MNLNLSFKAIVSIVVLFLLAWVGMNSYTTVSPGHNKVAAFFGEIRDQPLPEGFHVVNPLLKFYTYDLRVHTETWERVQVPSQDKLKTSMDISVTFRINPSHTPTMLQETGDLNDVIVKLLTPKVRSLLREAGKTVAKSQDFYLDTTQRDMQLFMEDGLTDYMFKKGITVEAVLFRDITLPQVVTSAVIEREKAQLRIVEQQAQQQVKQAEAREQAAKSDANAVRTLADAEAYQIEKLADAQARANTVLAKSVTSSLIKYNAIAKWDGAYPQTLMGGGPDGLILQLPATD